MQITHITPVHFGHSKRSQGWLERKSDKLQDKKLGENIKHCSNLCNAMEDEFLKTEAKNGKVNPKSDYVDFFLALKSAIVTTAISVFDDSQEYLETEYDYYSKGLNRRPDKKTNWRNKLLEQLRFWDSNLGKSPEEIKKELEEAKEYKRIGQMQVTEVLKNYSEHKEATATSTENSPIVEKIQKTEFSPNGFSDVMGMERLKQQLTEDVVEPVNNPKRAKLDFEEYGKRMPEGILLYGPPGCGKTFIVEAMSSEIDTPVYIMNSANTGSKFVNQTSNNIKKAFEHVYREGEKSEKPVFIFLDEMDAMTRRDGSVSGEDIKQVATLLKYIEEAKAHNVIVVGATNKYDMVDSAVRRRFDVKSYVGLPDVDQRMQLLKNNLSKKKKGLKLLQDEDGLRRISKSLEGYSCHSVNIIANNASINALRRNRADISVEDFELAIKETDEEKINEKEYKTITKNPSIGFAR